MEKKYISVSKRQVKKMLELYALEAYTQQEIGEIVFKRKQLYGLTPNTVVQRVFHYLGINMEHRSDKAYEGITSNVISQVLGNRLLVYPLQIAVEGKTESTFDFEKALEEAMGTSDVYRKKGYIKDLCALLILAGVNYIVVANRDLLWVPSVAFLVLILILTVRKTNESRDRFIYGSISIVVFAIFMIAMYFLGK